jgi:hypothetical protein
VVLSCSVSALLSSPLCSPRTKGGLAFLAFLSATTPFWAIVSALALLGFGFALFSSPNTNAVMSSVEKSVYGVAAGTLATMRMTGQTLSIGIAMLIFALMIGRVQITSELYPQFVKSIDIAFGVFAALCIAGVFSSLARGAVRGKKSSIADSGPTMHN